MSVVGVTAGGPGVVCEVVDGVLHDRVHVRVRD